MDSIRDNQRLVPKVHPATRSVASEDPLEMLATQVPGDPEVMLQCLIQEYASMGWNAGQIFQLFADPAYPALHSLLQACGEAAVRERIADLLDQTGVFRCEGTVIEEPEPTEEPELVQLGIPANWKGGDHANGL
jgi:hypothetical protein